MQRIFAFLLAAASILTATGCSTDSTGSAATAVATPAGTPPDSTAGHAGGHTYACPMHPEVTSTKHGQKCPKCGMELVHNDQVSNGKTYQMKFESRPRQLAASQAAVLTYTPQEVGNEATPVPLAVVHEKKIHLIIVRKDLSVFYHEHPEFTAEGNYRVPFTFAQGGDYVLFQDYTPDGSGHQLGRQVVTVQGPKYSSVKFDHDQMQWRKDGYQATLSFNKALKVGQLLAMKINLVKNGQPVTDLDNYLGALGHVVVISEDTEHYLHVHPNDQADKGPNIGFNTSFEKPGRYRVFLQFNHAGQIHTADFTINVSA